MRYLINLILLAAVALITGFGLSYFTLERGSTFGALTIGPWVAWPAIGIANPDPYTNAYLSRRLVLQLNIAEGIRFVAKTDASGTELTSSCSYLVEGDVPSVAFWTLTAVDAEGRFLAVDRENVSLNSNNLLRRDDGSFVIHVGNPLSTENWLEIEAGETFEIILNLYEAGDFVGIGEQTQSLPTIVLERCEE